ncbi:hypothetical protein [Pseudomonas sp. Irchel 3H3]|uniref:hypothetical protein n=1 Tax=Pseudomonas sp. Irchel 3H3 TaxID=2009038 RepID=UPI000BA3CECC|nr:hypothetical protein [Pseudomonas sp. Irchel 3H3]
MNNSTVRFAPWVGPHYERGCGGLRILLVCESHYGAKQHERPTVTPEIIKALALGQRHPKATGKLRRHPHFTKIMTAVQNVRQAFTGAQKADFWSSVAYYNFLQEFLPDSRVPPPQGAWQRGERAFSEVLAVLAPDLIVCFSVRNGKLIRSLAGDVPVAVVNHPSSRFTYAKVNPVIAEQKDQALVRKTQGPAFVATAAFDRWSEATACALPTPGQHLCAQDKAALIAQRREAMAALDQSSMAWTQ